VNGFFARVVVVEEWREAGYRPLAVVNLSSRNFMQEISRYGFQRILEETVWDF